MPENPKKTSKTETAESPKKAKPEAPPPPAVEPRPAPGEPFELAVLPLQNTTLFPETVVPLAIGRAHSIAAVQAALATEEKLIACISVRGQGAESDPKPTDLYEIGTLVMIKRMERIEDAMHIIAQGTDRIKVIEWKQEEPYLDRKSVV